MKNAPPTHTAAATTCTALKNVYQVMREIEACASDERNGPFGLEQLLQLHCGAHIPFDLELAGHVGAGRVLLAAGDLVEGLLGRRDRHIRVFRVVGHRDISVLDVDLPLARALDVEEIRVVHARGLGGVDAALEGVEKLLCAHGSNPISAAGSSLCRPRAEGSRRASTLASSGAAAATKSAVRRLVMSASRPRPTAATPPRPTDNPITSPDAVPTCLGMYSWPITIVTPKVPTTETPTSASAIAPTTPPTSTNTSTSGPVAKTLARSTDRRPKRSASGPSASVPTPPAKSISASRWFPCDLEWPRETSQSGTKVTRPNHATLRSATTPRRSFIANGSSLPVGARGAPGSGAKPRR